MGEGRHQCVMPAHARNIWTVLVPSIAIAMVALGFNLTGDALRDRLDPRGRR